MDYTAYSTEDFLADESFQSFVVDGEPAASQFWRAWLVQNPNKEAEFQEAAKLLQLLAANQPQPLPKALLEVEAAKLWHSMHPPVAPRAQPALRVARRRTRAVVALLLLLLVAGGLWFRRTATPTQPAWTSYTTHNGEHQQVQLPDGSVVVLNANSVLKLATTWQAGQQREVWLQGEAFFKVQHTAPAQLKTVAAAPANVKFTVHAGPLDVAVLGTQFNVLNRPGQVKVVLKSGQVQLSHPQAGRAVQLLMKPGELAEYRPATPQAPLAKRTVNPAFYSAWTTGHLDFDNTPVSEIVALLQDTYALQISVRDPALLRQNLTGSVPNRDVDVLLDALSKSLDVKVRREGNHVWLE